MPYVEELKYEEREEVFRTVCESKLFKIVILGCYKRSDWKDGPDYHARVTLSLHHYNKDGKVCDSSGSYIANEIFKTEQEAINWLYEYGMASMNQANWLTTWEKF